jgi:gliding motility-associated-like protein
MANLSRLLVLITPGRFHATLSVGKHHALCMLCAFLFWGLPFDSKAQFVDITQVEPYASVTSVCDGGTLTFRLNNLQGLNPGSIITMELSNLPAYPWTTCNTLSWSTNNITYTPGPYIWNGNISNSYIRVQIPPGAPAGTGYTARAVSSSPNISGGNNNGSITITPAYTTIPQIPQTDYGINQWIGHHYTWTPTVAPGTLINTTPLINAQTFFDPANYFGHTVQSPLSFDNDYQNNGIPGAFFAQTSIPCGNVQYNNVAIRFKRTENFSPGRYTFTIQADDGIRLSLDGGATWILDSFLEQTYAGSFKTTATTDPLGICLSGPTNLVIEYFQRPGQARVTFSCTQNGTIANTPVSQSICENDNSGFDATSSDPSATYQWQVSSDGGITWNNLINAVPYSNVTGPVLGITNALAAINNTLYRCLVGGVCGIPLATPSAELEVNPVNSINTQPVSISLCGASTGSFTTVANAPNSNYQWYVSIDNGVTFQAVVQGGIYGNPSLSTLNLNGLTSANNGYQFYCIVGSCGGNLTSNTVTLNFGGTPANIITQPTANIIVCANSISQIIVNVQNQTSIQWEYSTDGGVNFSNAVLPVFFGGQTQTLEINPVNANMDAWVFRVKITDCNGVIYSQISTLNIEPSPNVQVQPPAQVSVCTGGGINISCTGNNTNFYQWQINLGTGFTNLADGMGITGSATSNLTVNPVPAGWTNATLRCQLFGNCPPVAFSVEVNVVFDNGSSITSQPVNQLVCPGDAANFSIATIGSGLSYAWQVSTNGGTSFTNLTDGGDISGSSTQTLTVGNITTPMNGHQYRCIVSGGCNGNINSNAAVLTINTSSPTFTQQPTGVAVCEGQAAGMTVLLFGNPSGIDYQWEIDPGTGIFSPLADTGSFSGTGTNQLAFIVDVSLINATIRCKATQCALEVTSLSAPVIVNLKPRVLTQPNSTVVCIGQNGLISLSASGTALNYQWQISPGTGIFTNVSATDPVFVGSQLSGIQIISPDMIYNGYLFRCSISGTCTPTAYSDVVKLTVSELPEIIRQPTDVTVCEGQSGSLSLESRGVASRYKWYLSSPENPAFSATFPSDFDSIRSDSLIVRRSSFDYNGVYLYCEVSGCNKLLISEKIRLFVEPNILGSFIPSAFTPNNDELNDTWMIKSEYIQSIKGEIYDRWGGKVYSFTSMDEVWDGTSAGLPCPYGVYTFNIRGTSSCGEFSRKGSIYLMR